MTNVKHSDLRGPAMTLLRHWLDMAFDFFYKQKNEKFS